MSIAVTVTFTFASGLSVMREPIERMPVAGSYSPASLVAVSPLGIRMIRSLNVIDLTCPLSPETDSVSTISIGLTPIALTEWTDASISEMSYVKSLPDGLMS